MANITPFLWFEDKAEHAMEFYAHVFEDSKKGNVVRFGDEVPGPKGKVMSATINLLGQEFMILNGGPNGDQSKFNDSVSFMVAVDTQDEVDYYWEALTAGGGKPGPCGWLKDKYGLSWQVVPKRLMELTGNPDPDKARRATMAMMKMTKINLAELEAAAA